jgi:YidC/Oxa1 family membrane protein insertase
LTFTYRHPTQPFAYEVVYTFHPDRYLIDVSNRVSSSVPGLDPNRVFTDLGHGIPFNEQKDRDEERAAAYVVNHQQQGIRSQLLSRVDVTRIEEGPLLWAVFKSKYFIIALLSGSTAEEEVFLGGAVAEPTGVENRVALAVSQPVASDGTVNYRLYVGPQEFSRLEALGSDMQNANPYGWKFMRPIVRPFAGIIIKILSFLHENLKIGYGWVLILFGVMMRIVLFPLNQKGMKAQMRNMAVQPLMQEIQAKYKDQPEKLQKEMMKLYKEHGFNPLAGCLPLLLPWPVLIALFFVFQNTIELRGVSFLWLPDLSAPDPFFILPVFLGLSMFLLQWVSMRSMPQQNPQMKMMMYVMPVMMVFIFFQLASGLNLYYATANIATLPQQIYIANERKKAQAKPPLTASS